MKVVAIAGSPRPEGNSTYLVDQVLEVLKSRNIETEKIILNQYKIAPCQGHSNCRDLKKCLQQDDAPWIMDKYVQADGLIISSPVYFDTITAQVKTFMDRTYFFGGHGISPKTRCFGLIAYAGGGGADEALRELKKFTGRPGECTVPVFTLTTSGKGSGKHVRENSEVVKQAHIMGEQIADLLLIKKA